MSRPSATQPPSPTRARWRSTIAARTRGWTETREASPVTSGERIALVTSSPAIATEPGPMARSRPSARCPIAAPSSGSVPLLDASSATQRYIAPESRYVKPRRSASALATVDFPAPAGPSMAITIAG